MIDFADLEDLERIYHAMTNPRLDRLESHAQWSHINTK